MRKGLVLSGLVLGCTLLAPVAQVEPGTDGFGGISSEGAIGSGVNPEIRRLVRDLSDDRYSVREESERALLRSGADAVPLLLEAAIGEDPEVRWRSRRILRACLVSVEADTMERSEKLARAAGASNGGALARFVETLLSEVTEERMRVGRERLEALGALLSDDSTSVTFGEDWKGGDADVALLRLLPMVSSVIFKECGISDGAPRHLRGLPALTFANFNHVAITDAGAADLAALTQLTDLRLRGTKVTNEGLACVRGMSGLETLSIEHSLIDDEGLVHLAELRELRRFYAGRSKVRGRGLKLLWDLPKLRYLSLEGADFTDEGMPFLEGLKHLETLGLDGTEVGDGCAPTLLTFPDLDVLWLSGSEVTDGAVKDLAKLTRLSKLHLRNTRITEKKAEELRAALPEVEVNHSYREALGEP